MTIICRSFSPVTEFQNLVELCAQTRSFSLFNEFTQKSQDLIYHTSKTKERHANRNIISHRMKNKNKLTHPQIQHPQNIMLTIN